MIFLWFVLLFLWFLIIIFVDVNIPTILWWFLLLLWIGVIIHYIIIYHGWKGEINLRKQERREQIELEKKNASPEE